MNPQFNQPKGSTTFYSNKQAVARKFGVKASEVLFAASGASLTGMKVIFEPSTERFYSLPTGLSTTVTSLADGILVHSGGTVDLGALAVSRKEYVTLAGDFTSGQTIRVKNEILLYNGDQYIWQGALPKTVAQNSTPDSSGGVGSGAWALIQPPYKGGLADEVKVWLNVFLDPTYLVSRWGAIGDGTTDDSVAIQKAVNAIPANANLVFDKPSYVLSNINLPKGISLTGAGFSQGGIQLINNHATNPTFKATDVNNIKMSGFYFNSSVTRTSSANGYLNFVRCHRVTVCNSFFWEYYLACSFDGGTEINFDTCEGFTTKNGTGSGFAWFGANNYTGSINVVNCYFKVDDSTGSLMPEFGLRFGYVDVAYVDGSTTIIRHGHDIEVVPNGATQFAHLIKIVGGILDTAKAGIYVQPVNGADAEVELVGCYSAAMSAAAWVFDGTNGKVTATLTGGQIFNCGVSAVEVLGSGVTVFLNGLRLANNQLGIHVTNNGTLYADSPYMGDWDNVAGNQYPFSCDATAKGHIKSPVLRNNINAGVNLSSTFDVCDVWTAYNPTITPVGGTLGPVTVASSRYKISNKTVEYEVAFTVSDNLATGGLVVSLPRPPRTHLVGNGRNVTQGAMLQCAADPGNTSMLVVRYDNSHPVSASGNLLVARAIYEIL